ncbi:MAG TPA: galactokinase [Bacillales bacterium]|nr:galactokinase [Bacillales bacterium]
MGNKMIERFQHYFPGNNDGIRVFFAPGRVNLIGEHTDYNGGYVLPAALTLGTYMAVRPRQDRQFNFFSESFPNQPVSFSTQNVNFESDDPWGNYPKGVVNELLKMGMKIAGADVYYSGNIPNAAGLSSSASIGMVTAFGLTQMSGEQLPIKDLAKLIQKVENDFIGVSTGIMDQFAVGFGKKDQALFLNCRTLEYEKVPLELGDYQLVITNTNKSRGLADSKYNERRTECEQGLKEIQKVKKNIQSLGELTIDEFRNLQDNIKDSDVLRRVRHVVTENERVKLARKVLKKGDVAIFGDLMKQSHESLRDDYEVTGLELDALFNAQKEVRGCVGTRMTGAGFGGCTVSIVLSEAVPEFKKQVQEKYEQETGFVPSFYICEAGDGVKELKEVMV